MLALIALHARTTVHTWEHSEYGPEQHKRILAFTEPVRAVKNLPPNASLADVQAAAQIWIEQPEDSILGDILPPCVEANGERRIVDEIVAARDTLAQRLSLHAERLAAEGQYGDSAKLQVQIMQLADVAKYSTFSTVASSARTQLHSADRITALAAKISESERVEIAHAALSVRSDARPANRLLNRLRALHITQSVRSGDLPIAAQTNRAFDHLASLTNPESMEAASTQDDWIEFVSGKGEVAYLRSQTKVAMAHEAEFQTAIQKLVRTLIVGDDVSP